MSGEASKAKPLRQRPPGKLQRNTNTLSGEMDEESSLCQRIMTGDLDQIDSDIL